MIATLRLEAIGDNYRRLMASGTFSRVLRQCRRIPAHAQRLLDNGMRPWVAHVTGRDARHGLARTFLEGLRDYRDANSGGSRGVYLTFVLYPGRIYEVNEVQSWTRKRRYFCHVVNGAPVELSVADVATRLDLQAATIQAVIDRAKEPS